MHLTRRIAAVLMTSVAAAACYFGSGVIENPLLSQALSSFAGLVFFAPFVWLLLSFAAPASLANLCLKLFSEYTLLSATNKRAWMFSNSLAHQIHDKVFQHSYGRMVGQGDSDVGLLGDLFMGDRHSGHMHGDYSEGDASSYVNEGDDIEGDYIDGDYVEGDSDKLFSAGDMFTGDVRRSPIGKFLISGTRKMKKRLLSPEMEKKVRAIAANPGAYLTGKDVSPLMVNNCVVNIAPTRAMVPGQSLVESVTRSESMYNGRTRTQVFNVAAGGSQTVTFAAPSAGEVALVPLIFAMVSVKVLSAIANAEVRLTLTALDESNSAVNALTWSVMLPKNGNAALITLVPFSEISTTVYARIVQANATNNLVLTVAGLPADAYLRVFLPGADSTQYQYFKEGLGITKLPTKLARYVRQN